MAIGSVWGPFTWGPNTWAPGTWADAAPAPEPEPEEERPGGGTLIRVSDGDVASMEEWLGAARNVRILATASPATASGEGKVGVGREEMEFVTKLVKVAPWIFFPDLSDRPYSVTGLDDDA